MATRQKPITPFQQGQSTNEHPDKTKTAKVNANMSDVRNSGTEGSLHAALGHRGLPLLPSDNHVYTHTTTVKPVGAHYSPAGEFGKRKATGTGKGVYSYGGAPNKKGDNPLGKAMNKVGEKSGYKKLAKQSGGGGKHV